MSAVVVHSRKNDDSMPNAGLVFNRAFMQNGYLLVFPMRCLMTAAERRRAIRFASEHFARHPVSNSLCKYEVKESKYY